MSRVWWPSSAYVVSEYGDGRVKTTWMEVSDKLRRFLVDIEPETWICHPFLGFSVYFFRRHMSWRVARQPAEEMEKERVYTRLDNLAIHAQATSLALVTSSICSTPISP